MSLVEANWAQNGLISTRALLPDGESPAPAAVALLEFATAEVIDTAPALPEARTVFGDFANFTNIAPVAQKYF